MFRNRRSRSVRIVSQDHFTVIFDHLPIISSDETEESGQNWLMRNYLKMGNLWLVGNGPKKSDKIQKCPIKSNPDFLLPSWPFDISDFYQTYFVPNKHIPGKCLFEKKINSLVRLDFKKKMTFLVKIFEKKFWKKIFYSENSNSIPVWSWLFEPVTSWLIFSQPVVVIFGKSVVPILLFSIDIISLWVEFELSLCDFVSDN